MSYASIEEKRAHRRLNIRLPMEFKKEGASRSNALRTVTLNISTGGVYFETAADYIKPQDNLDFELGVPPDDGRFPPQGKITTKGKVLRTTLIEDAPQPDGLSYPRYGVAAQFEQGFKLKF